MSPFNYAAFPVPLPPFTFPCELLLGAGTTDTAEVPVEPPFSAVAVTTQLVGLLGAV
jgi:hypothetical protein